MMHPFDYYGRIRELEEKLKAVELENERLKKALGTRSLARLKRIESAQAAARTLRNDEAIKPKFCTVCEAPLTPRAGAGRPKKTCSLACAKKRNRILTRSLMKKVAP